MPTTDSCMPSMLVCSCLIAGSIYLSIYLYTHRYIVYLCFLYSCVVCKFDNLIDCAGEKGVK